MLTDGRDVPDGSSLRFIAELEAVLKELQASLLDCVSPRRCLFSLLIESWTVCFIENSLRSWRGC